MFDGTKDGLPYRFKLDGMLFDSPSKAATYLQSQGFTFSEAIDYLRALPAKPLIKLEVCL